MKNIKLVIFDLDGTLINAYPAIISSFNYTLSWLNYPKQPPLIIKRAVGWGDENLLKPFVRKKDLKKALLIYRKHHRHSLVKQSRLFPQAKEILRYLKAKGYKLAVASNRPTEFSWILIRNLRLKEFFDYVLCADRLENIKPHPEILNKIMQHFSLQPKETVYIGDMVIDAQAGRRAKVTTLMVTTGSSTKEEIRKERPYRILDKVSQLKRIL
jgi:phosphoglycolate phosphatase